MEKKGFSREVVVNDLISLFDIGSNNSLYENGCFMISKQDFERGVVLDMLTSYFTDKYIIGGGISIDSITFAYTVFRFINVKD